MDEDTILNKADQFRKTVIQDLHSYSTEGFRTLVIAMRTISDKEYKRFLTLYGTL